MTETSDHAVASAMILHGGRFVAQLGQLFMVGDDDNRHRLKCAFPELFGRYTEIARQLVGRQQQRSQAIGQIMRDETLKSIDYRLANDDLDGYDYTGGGR